MLASPRAIVEARQCDTAACLGQRDSPEACDLVPLSSSVFGSLVASAIVAGGGLTIMALGDTNTLLFQQACQDRVAEQ